MAISAYKGERLKKHALLGTSLAADPARMTERKTFKDLYARARAHPGMSRAALRENVATEFYGGERAKGLAAIAKARGQIGILGGEISDIEAKRKAALGDIEKSGAQAGHLSRILGTKKYKKWRKQRRWESGQLKKYGITDDYRRYREGLAQSGFMRDMGAQADALAYARSQGLQFKMSPAQMRKRGPQMYGYLASLAMKERSAQEYLPGAVSSLAEKRAQLGDLQSSIQETYVPTSAKAKVYSGFFGGY